jgi:hypothetical protein
MTENEIANKVIGLAIDVHRVLGLAYSKVLIKKACTIKYLNQDYMLKRKSQCH